ncbi:MAG: SMP-30/gluconolactonase/LRE family protein, partial [Xanthomonadales bacterium]|nr:SMP-30/gluconolactonase/LRE family protein [Xanthomonadales bacterium]
MLRSLPALTLLACLLPGSQTPAAEAMEKPYPHIGQVHLEQAAMAAQVDPQASIEKLVDGMTWAEGPAWVREGDGGFLLFNDVPQNTMYRWSDSGGLAVFLQPSGYVGPEADTLREAGANGLFPSPDGSVLLADSGSRLLARLDPATRKKSTLTDRFDGKRFNSPNDVVLRGDGRIYFTDPPYGLKEINDSPVKEQPHNGVYRLDPDGSVHLIDDQLSYPNGVALSPDGMTLYVANSDPERPIWMRYRLDADGAVVERNRFADASDLVKQGLPGLPDGMAMSSDGHLFATGPGGVWVFDPSGQRLGRIDTGTAVANCAFGDDGHSLYLTAHTALA